MQGGAMSYSTEDWLRDEGADTKKKGERRDSGGHQALTEFEHKFLNGVPSLEECLSIEPHLTRLHELLQKGKDYVDPHISEHARGGCTQLRNPL